MRDNVAQKVFVHTHIHSTIIRYSNTKDNGIYCLQGYRSNLNCMYKRSTIYFMCLKRKEIYVVSQNSNKNKKWSSKRILWLWKREELREIELLLDFVTYAFQYHLLIHHSLIICNWWAQMCEDEGCIFHNYKECLFIFTLKEKYQKKSFSFTIKLIYTI